jgi:hypothetical protein|tara:strand:- start:83 stop:256 length:174 start_codon:yes stop_codon:yes gene_type:complete
MKVGDLIYDHETGMSGLVLEKEGCFFRVLYDDGVIDPAADPGRYDVEVILHCAKDDA